MRAYENLILEARLVASPPGEVARFLEERAKQYLGREYTYDELGDEAVEAALIERHDPLIDLAVAKWCRFPETGQALFAANQDDTRQHTAVRLSLFSNLVLGGGGLTFGPPVLFDQRPLDPWLSGASDEELAAFFASPRLSDGFLQNFFEGKVAWNALTEDQRRQAIHILATNRAMKAPYTGGRTRDGYSEYLHNAARSAAWRLAETVPVGSEWASALNDLFSVLPPYPFKPQDPLEVAERWRPAAANEIEREASAPQAGYLSNYQGVRSNLARLALASNPGLRTDFLASEDAALRCTAYRDAPLTRDELHAAFLSDGHLVPSYAMHNKALWRSRIGQYAMKELIRTASAGDPADDHGTVLTYNITTERMEAEHPDWFDHGEAERPFPPDQPTWTEPADHGKTSAVQDPLEAPASKADLERLETVLLAQGSNSTGLNQLLLAVQSLHKRAGWIWWFSLGALVASVAHRF